MNYKGLRVLVTAGPTREFFDPVRFLSNPSSGKMGYAIAKEALRRGARVTLISGPTALEPPGCRVVQVVSAAQMHRATLREAKKARLIIMTAAVSDFTPVAFSRHKVKKKDASLTLKLKPTKDILKELGTHKRPGQVLVGFAAETEALKKNALNKMAHKNLDAIVANRVGSKGAGFAGDTNKAALFDASGHEKRLSPMTKDKMAREIFNFLRSVKAS